MIMNLLKKDYVPCRGQNVTIDHLVLENFIYYFTYCYGVLRGNFGENKWLKKKRNF